MHLCCAMQHDCGLVLAYKALALGSASISEWCGMPSLVRQWVAPYGDAKLSFCVAVKCNSHFEHSMYTPEQVHEQVLYM